jgi:DNA-binding winged helix-turn-helix (wHTH) protein/Tol biopolymer transport system component
MGPFLEPVVRFHKFELNVHTGELRKSGRKLKLAGQPAQILSILLERPGQMVSRDEIQNRLWPDTFVDVDHNLNAAINKIREVLGDSAESPRYLETIPRRGYRFIAPVRNGDGSKDEASRDDGPGEASANVTAVALGIGTAATQGASDENAIAAPARSPLSSLRLTIAALAVGVLISLASWIVWTRSNHNKLSEEKRVVSNAPENPIRSMTSSPDGRYLAYQDNTGIFLKALQTGETHAIQWPHDVPARVDGWFPDASNLLISRQDVSSPSLWRVSIFGGVPVKLVENASGGSVSPDGSQIAFHRYKRAGDPGTGSIWITRVDASREIELVPESEHRSSLWGIAWSPDSQKIAFVRFTWSYVSNVGDIQVLDLATGNLRTIISRPKMGVGLVWSRDGRILYLQTEPPPNDADSNVWNATIDENLHIGTPVQLTSGPGWVNSLSATVDANSVFYLKNYSQQQTFVASLSSDGSRITSHKRLAADESLNVATAWTADSQFLLTMSNRNGTEDIYKQPRDGSLPEPLAMTSQNESQPRLSPDGREVLYLSVPTDPSPEEVTTIMAVPVEGGAARRILNDNGIWNLQCARAPSTLCMYANQRGPRMTLFRFDVTTGKAVQAFTENSIGNWSLSPDGNLIAMTVSGSERDVIQLISPMSGQRNKLKVTGRGSFMNVDWAADGKTLLLTAADAARRISLLRVSLDGHVTVLLEHADSLIAAAVPSPDGRSLAIGEYHLGPTTIWIRNQ